MVDNYGDGGMPSSAAGCRQGREALNTLAKLKAVLTKEEHEALPDQLLKDVYAAKGDIFVLNADVESHPDLAGLKTTVNTLRQERKKAEDDLEKLRGLGDPEKARAALAKVQELEEQEAKKAGEWDKLKLQMQERHKQETTDLSQQIKDRDAEIERLVVDARINEALADPKLGVISPVAIFPHVKQRVKAQKENGQWVPLVHDGKGGPVVQDGAGNPMTIPGLIEDMRKNTSFAPLFASRSTGGSGTPPNGSSAGGDGGPKKIKKSDAEGLSRNIKEIAAGTVVVED